MNKTFADKLISLRAAAGLSQEEVAQRINSTPEKIAEWECCTATPSPDEIIALANVYGVSPDSLFALRYSVNRVKVKVPFVDININGDDDDDDNSHCKNKNHAKHFSGENHIKHRLYSFPYPILALVAFFVMIFLESFGVPEETANIFGKYAWLVFLTIPVYYWIASLIIRKKVPTISVSGAVLIIYLILGFCFKLWHPAWILFIAIPIFDFIFKKKS